MPHLSDHETMKKGHLNQKSLSNLIGSRRSIASNELKQSLLEFLRLKYTLTKA